MVCDPDLPTLRAAMFTAVSVGLGAGVYRLTSDSPIPAWALVVGGVGAYLFARYAAGWVERRGLLAVAGAMGALQVAVHLLFSYAQATVCASTAAATIACSAMPGVYTPGCLQVSAGTSAAGMPDVASPATLHMSTGMLLGDALAVAVCVFWLRRGEAAVHAVLRSALIRLDSLWLVIVIAARPVDRVARTMPIVRWPHTLRSQWLRGTFAQRGPPSQVVYL